LRLLETIPAFSKRGARERRRCAELSEGLTPARRAARPPGSAPKRGPDRDRSGVEAPRKGGSAPERVANTAPPHAAGRAASGNETAPATAPAPRQLRGRGLPRHERRTNGA